MDATLLIVEPESRSRTRFERFLSRCGFAVDTAEDAWECLAKVRSLEPDLLFVDLQNLPAGAATVAAVLSETRFTASMPVVLVVGDGAPEALAEQTGVPPSLCFPKPVPMERLLDQLGLAAALIDLRGGGRPPRGIRRPSALRSREISLA